MIQVIYTAFHSRGGQCANLLLITGSEASFDWPTFSMWEKQNQSMEKERIQHLSTALPTV